VKRACMGLKERDCAHELLPPRSEFSLDMALGEPLIWFKLRATALACTKTEKGRHAAYCVWISGDGFGAKSVSFCKGDFDR
jgi:hypothetical protein